MINASRTECRLLVRWERLAKRPAEQDPVAVSWDGSSVFSRVRSLADSVLNNVDCIVFYCSVTRASLRPLRKERICKVKEP